MEQLGGSWKNFQVKKYDNSNEKRFKSVFQFIKEQFMESIQILVYCRAIILFKQKNIYKFTIVRIIRMFELARRKDTDHLN